MDFHSVEVFSGDVNRSKGHHASAGYWGIYAMGGQSPPSKTFSTLLVLLWHFCTELSWIPTFHQVSLLSAHWLW